MKKNILIILIGFFGFAYNVNAQTKTEKPKLATTSKTTKVENTKASTNKTEKAELKTSSKTTIKVVKKTKSEPKKSNASDTPKLSTMSKKEEK